MYLLERSRQNCFADCHSFSACCGQDIIATHWFLYLFEQLRWNCFVDCCICLSNCDGIANQRIFPICTFLSGPRCNWFTNQSIKYLHLNHLWESVCNILQDHLNDFSLRGQLDLLPWRYYLQTPRLQYNCSATDLVTYKPLAVI